MVDNNRGRFFLAVEPAYADVEGVTEDDITENAITLFFSRTGKSYNQKTL
jgi:hypothetical protein